MEVLQWQPHRQEPSTRGKVIAKGPRVTRVRYAANVNVSPARECPAWGKKCHKCGNKNNFSTCCRSKQSGARNRKSHSTSRGHKGKGKPHHSRSRSQLVTKSAHSIVSLLQDHSDSFICRTVKILFCPLEKMETSMEKVQTLMETRENLHEPTPFKTIRKVLIFFKNHFLPFLGQSLWPA